MEALGPVDRLLADLPRVHADLGAPPELGVWLTERECYELIAGRCAPGARTLETGLGVSTALFLLLGTDHTCVVPSQSEVDELLRYCHGRGIPIDALHVELGRSEDVLPRLDIDRLDLVLIDGNHGFPAPMIDWFYGAGRLRRGGVVVLDDLQLPAVALLVDFLDADPRWRALTRTSKWAAFERVADGPLAEDWYDQPFFPPKRARWRRALRRASEL